MPASMEWSREMALKLKARPAVRARSRYGVGWQQQAPSEFSTAEGLERILFLFFRAHGKQGRSDDHSEKDQGKNEIVNHLGESPLGGFGRLRAMMRRFALERNPTCAIRLTTKVGWRFERFASACARRKQQQIPCGETARDVSAAVRVTEAATPRF